MERHYLVLVRRDRDWQDSSLNGSPPTSGLYEQKWNGGICILPRRPHLKPNQRADIQWSLLMLRL
jgi:hypothetical protein